MVVVVAGRGRWVVVIGWIGCGRCREIFYGEKWKGDEMEGGKGTEA